MKQLYLYTDGGIRPDEKFPKGTGYGGIGCVCLKPLHEDFIFTISSYIDKQTTNQRMELLAVIKGLQTIQQFDLYQDYKIIVHSDSAYVVNCFLQEWWFNWMVKQNGGWMNSSRKPVENSDLWRELLSLCKVSFQRTFEQFGPQPWKKVKLKLDYDVILKSYESGLNVSFKKVKGHSGDPHNELADQLATQGKNNNLETV
jgi:ribonuclease HI